MRKKLTSNVGKYSTLKSCLLNLLSFDISTICCLKIIRVNIVILSFKNIKQNCLKYNFVKIKFIFILDVS